VGVIPRRPPLPQRSERAGKAGARRECRDGAGVGDVVDVAQHDHRHVELQIAVQRRVRRRRRHREPGLAALKPGDEGIFFLRPAVHPGQWVLTSSQGLYLRTAGGRLKGADTKDPLINQLSQSSDAKLNDDIKAAKQAVQDGELTSEPYPAGAPRPPS
jgi:hypothetical protein